MSIYERIAELDHATVDALLLDALRRLAFVRHTDAEYELGRLVKDFTHDEYKRSDVPQPADREVAS